MDSQESRRGRAQRAAEAGLAALLVAAVWCVDYLPTHDGPQHIFAIHAANHLDDASNGYGRYLELASPVTNHGFALLYAPFDRLLPWRLALRLALTLLVLLWAAGCFALARAVHPARGWLGVALSAAAFQWSFYMGLFSFQAATGFGLLVLALGYGAPRWDRRRRLLLSVLLLIQALLHVVPAIVTGAMLASLALFRAEPGARLRELARIALLGAPAAGVAAALSGVGLAALGDFNQQGATGWTNERAGFWTLAGCFVSGPAWRAWPLTLLALASPAVALAASRTRLRAEDRSLLAAGLLLLAAALALPLDLRAWDFFSVRFAPMAVCALLLALPFERLSSAPLRRAGVVALVGYAFAASAWAFAYHRDLAARSETALAGLDAPLSRNGPRLPIVLDPYLGRAADDRNAVVPYAVPLLNLGQLYAVAHGGLVPHSFVVNPHLHRVVLRDGAREAYPRAPDRRYAAELALPRHADDDELRRAITNYVGAHGTAYQDVILGGRPEDADQLLRLGFAADWRRGGLLIARFEGCPLELRFPPGSGLQGNTVVEIGWLPAWHVTHRYAIGGARHEPDGWTSLPIHETPCGGVWLRFQDGERACEGADAEGRLRIASTQATPVVECRVRSARVHAGR